jgi:hypothetical protein
MDEKKTKSSYCFSHDWCLHMMMQHVLNMQTLTFNGGWETTMILNICFDAMNRTNCSMWSYERQIGFIDRFLLGLFTERMFKQRTCVSQAMFCFLCEKLGPYFQRQNTHMRKIIFVESKVAMSLQRLGIGNMLCSVGEIYGVVESSI